MLDRGRDSHEAEAEAKRCPGSGAASEMYRGCRFDLDGGSVRATNPLAPFRCLGTSFSSAWRTPRRSRHALRHGLTKPTTVTNRPPDKSLPQDRRIAGLIP